MSEEDQERHLLELLKKAGSEPDDETMKTLLMIYTSTVDWITQERIETVLADVDKSLWIRIVLQEMPVLIQEAPGWAVSLLGEEVEHRFELVRESLQSMPAEVQSAVLSVTKSEDYSSFYANADSLF